jgi:hypothetical protein
MLKWTGLFAAAIVGAVTFVALPLGADEPASVATPAAQTPTVPASAPVKTGKERLSSKASDEQRVDNCKVPPELRGTRVRPDTCEGRNQAIPTN